MPELRYNPLLGDWTMVAANRQHRPSMPKDYCPFCPGSGKVPDSYTVHKYDNDFPALMPEPPEPDALHSSLYRNEKAHGKCEVVLYSSSHTATLKELPVDHLTQLVDLWTERFEALGQDPQNKYVMIFENRGEECGVTMPHPHGQIYAYSQLPLKIRTELDNCRQHHAETGRCLICDMNHAEVEEGHRVIHENDSFLAYLPYFTDYPYGLFIVSKNHKTALTDMTAAEKRDLAAMLQDMTGAMDTLFDKPFPYMMVMHQRPVNGEDVEEFYHFHIEFYTPLREANRLKYYASSEMGAWACCNPQAVEDTAVHLREAFARWQARAGSEVAR